jgi:hypothetical protein
MPAGGVVVQDSDVIYTGTGVFVDARVTPGSALIRIAENTVLSFNKGSRSSDSLIISLMYGRIRVDQESRTETIVVKSGVSTTETLNGSVNIDYTVSSNLKHKSQPALSVSVISGNAEVIPSEKARRVMLKRGVALAVDPQNGRARRRSMSKDIPAYWQRVGESPPVTVTPTPAASPLPSVPTGNASSVEPARIANFTPVEVSTVLKTESIIAGLSILLVGVAVQSAGHYLYSNVDEVFYAGYAPIGVGVFILAGSYIYPTYVNAKQLKAAATAAE